MSKISQIVNFHILFRCNLDRLKLLQDKLPLDGKYSEVWLGVNKLIDPLHLKNHKVFNHDQHQTIFVLVCFSEARV